MSNSKYQHETAHTVTVPMNDLTTLLRRGLRAEGAEVPDRFTVEALMMPHPHGGTEKILAGLLVKWLGDGHKQVESDSGRTAEDAFLEGSIGSYPQP